MAATLSNTGNASLTGITSSITGSGASDFAITTGTNACGSTLAAGSSCYIYVTFTPASAASFGATLSVADSASGSPQTVSLSGTGIGIVTVLPTSYIFLDSQAVGSSSASVSFTVSNSESTAVAISGVSLSNAQFSQTNTCGNSLAAGASCTISVTFTPQSNGEQSATLSVSDSASGSPQTVSLSGVALGMVTVLPTSYIFLDSQAVGSSSAPVSFTVSNSEATAAAISGIAISNTQFSQTNTCGTSLAAGASCTISVTFTPQSNGEQSATLSVSDSASGSPQNAGLNGVGSGALAFSPSRLTFVSQLIGRPSTPQVIGVTNIQSTSVTITSITSTASTFSISDDCIPSGSGAGTLGPGASCSISVTFEPSVGGAVRGSIIIANNAAGSPESLVVSADGVVDQTGVTLVVTPQSSCILPSSTQQFSALMQNTSNTAVAWYVDDVESGNSQSGSISAQGLYSAPSTAGTHTVEAISQADTSVTATTTILVTTNPYLSIFPATSSIPISSQQSFQGQICGVPDSNVAWSVDNTPGGSTTVGTITTSGIYTAPAAPGQHTIQATYTVPSESKKAVAVVYSSVSVDFGSRTNTQYPILPGILGINQFQPLLGSSAEELIYEAGIRTSRTFVHMRQIYATANPDWSEIDPIIADLQANGMHALLNLQTTPEWLEPTPGPCFQYTDSFPADDSVWAQFAVAVVSHMDAKFPGVVTDYEIWNEPNAMLCGDANLDTYLALYAAAAPAMKQQAAADGATIRVGGPALSDSASVWIPAFLSNSSTAPYVDFVSTHGYYSDSNLTWDSYNGLVPLYQTIQQSPPTDLNIFNLVAAGDQPGGANTPIYQTEYGADWENVPNCCQNDPVYAPVFVALFVSDQLDVAFTKQAQVPGALDYWSAYSYPYICLIGTWDTYMDCQMDPGSSPVPYPQYYAFQIMGAPQYLNLNSGGYMAAAVSPSDGGGGPVFTAFYTSNQDSILIVNPTSMSYAQISFTLLNIGLSSPLATLYQIVSPVPESGQAITSSSLTLTQSGAAYTATVSVPPYSVMGITIK